MMTRYKLKELKQTDAIEQRIRQKVQQQISQPKRKRLVHIPILTAIVTVATIFIIIQLLAPQTTRHTATSSLMNVFHEIDGDGVAYSEDYYQLDQQHTRTLNYYREIPLATFLQANDLTMIELPLPFTIEDGTVIAVNDGYLTEIQIHFERDDAFINISMAKSYSNQIEYADFHEIKQDAYGTPIELERINPVTTLAKKWIQGDGGIVYKYYQYNEEEDYIHLATALANTFYSSAGAFIYYIGYSQQNTLSHEQMTDFAKEFIINNEFTKLNFVETTFESSWLTRGGKMMLICLVIAIISLMGVPLLTQKRSQKVQKFIWSLVWIFIQAPILTWLISISVGTLYRDVFAEIGMMMMITFPFLLILGILIIIFAKRKRITWLVVLHVLTFVFAFGTSIWNTISIG